MKARRIASSITGFVTGGAIVCLQAGTRTESWTIVVADLTARKKCAKRGCTSGFVPRGSTHKYCLLHKSRKPRRHDHDVRYGPAHRRLRSEWAAKMRAGLRVECARCGERIRPGQSWDLGTGTLAGRGITRARARVVQSGYAWWLELVEDLVIALGRRLYASDPPRLERFTRLAYDFLLRQRLSAYWS